MPEVEWKQIGNSKAVKCSVCGTYRFTSGEQLRRLLTGERRNMCVSCSRKEIASRPRKKIPKRLDPEERKARMKIDYTCPNCGESRKIRWATLLTYESRGEIPWCSKCANGKTCATTLFARPIHGPLPVAQAPSRELTRGPYYTCIGSGYFDGIPECKRYEKCLDWACALNWQGFVCGLPNQEHRVEEAPQRETLALAYEHSVLEGFLPEQEQQLALR